MLSDFLKQKVPPMIRPVLLIMAHPCSWFMPRSFQGSRAQASNG